MINKPVVIPAFPVSTIDGFTQFGMPLRDYFAAAIAQGGAANPNICEPNDERAAWAYQVADEMLRMRELTHDELKQEIQKHRMRVKI